MRPHPRRGVGPRHAPSPRAPWCAVSTDHAVATPLPRKILAPFQRKVAAEAQTWRAWRRGRKTPRSIYIHTGPRAPHPLYYYFYIYILSSIE